MDAAQKTYPNSRVFLLIALALVVAAPGWSQTPAFSLSTSSVSFNQSVTGADVSVGSSGDPITFSSSIAYAADGGNGSWLRITQTSPSTPSIVSLNLASVAGLGTGTFSATVTLTPSAPAGVGSTNITVSYAHGSGGGGGGGGTITASPAIVNIGASGTNLGFGQSFISTSSVSPINISLGTPVTTNGGAWLTASLSSGTVSSTFQSTLNLQANPSFLANGTYQGTVTVTPATGSPVTVTVNFTVGGGGGSGTLTPTINPVSLTYFTGGSFPSLTESLTSSNGATTFFATASSTQGWLLVNGQSFVQGNIGQNVLLISAGSAVTSLATGSYTGNVALTDNNGGSTNITVNLTVNGGSSTGLSVSPTSLSFTSILGGGSQTANVSVSSTSGGTFTVAYSASWLFALVTSGSPIAANTAGNVQVTVSPGGLPNGTYNGTVTVTVGAQTQAISVTLTVGSGGGGGGSATGVAPSTVSLNWQLGTPSSFVNRPVLSITGTSGNWNSTITYGSGTGWLSLSPSSGATLPAQATILADPAGAGLTVGNYTATITVTTPGGSQNVTVNLAVQNGPVLVPTPGGLIFNYQTGQALPQGQSVFISGSDVTAFELSTVTTNATWLTVSTIQTGQKSFSVFADPTSLAGGVYTGAVTVTSTTLGSVTVPVVLVINGGSGGGGSVGPLTFSSNALSFSAAAGANPSSQSLSVTASSFTNFTVSSNQTWLSVSPTSGSTNTTVIVSVNSANLPSGTYNGALTFVAGGISQTVSVSLTVGSGGGGTGGNVTVTPSTGLTFTGQTGSGTLPVQAVTVTSVSGSAVFFSVNPTTTSGGTWLTVTPPSGNTTQQLTVTVTTAGLAAGTYQGNLQISPTGGAAVNVPVTLTVTAPPSVSVPSTPLTFTYRAGGANPPAQSLAVSGNGGPLAFTATASSNGNWLVVSPTSGITPAAVNVSINGTGLAAGSYSGTVTVAGANGAPGSTVVQVSLTVSVPLPTIARVGNAGSYASASISPGEVITLFGTDMGPSTPAGLALDSSGKVGTTLAGVQVTVKGFPAPLIYVSNTQVSAVVPYEVAPFASADVLVKYLGQSSNGVPINVTTTSPGLFTGNASGTGPGAILNQNNSTNSPSNPAARGETVVVYLTGEGQTNPAGVTGKVTTVASAPPLTPGPLLNPSVTIGGQGANFTFAGEAPGIVSGVMQINVVIPTTVGTGDLPIVVSIGGSPSQSGVTVSVR